MSTITTRAGKGSPLTNSEVDSNFDNLNADKLESVSESDVTQHQAAISITESQISDLDKYTQSEVDALLASLEAYDQSLNTTDDVAFASVQLTGGTGDQGTITWNTDEDTLDVVLNGATLQMGQEVHYHIRNNTGSTIADGVPVYATGTLGASGRITVAPYIANGTIPAKYFLGITTESIANGEDGKATHFGKVRHINTSAFTDGDVLYPSASTAGALTATMPTGSNVALPIAIVIHAASNGTLFVRATNHDENAYATAAQGALADSALQSGDNVSELINDAGYATTGYVDQAEADAISTASADATTKANAALASANAYTDQEVAALVDSSPATLDTLNELAAALGDDPNFATTVSGQIGTAQSTADTALTNANAALAKDPTLTLTGDASGSATFTNLGNATLTVTVADDSHNHVISNVDGLQTALNGKQATGDYIVASGDNMTGNLNFGDNDKAVFGAGSDLQIYHDGADSIIVDNGTGDLLLRGSNSIRLQSHTGETYFKGDLDGASKIYHNNAEKLVTTSTGVDVTGNITVSGTVDGRNVAADGSKLDGIATNANNYSHPSYAGDDFSIDTGALSGATVISDIDINVTTDTLGHVTDANATYSTRNLTAANIGAAPASHSHSYLPLSGGDLTGPLKITGNGTYVGGWGYSTLVLQDSNGYSGIDFRNGNKDWLFRNDAASDNLQWAWRNNNNYTERMELTSGGDLYLNGSNRVFHDGYHPNADKWTTARTLSLTGDVTGSVSWDGSGNASITATVADDSHNHTIANVDGLQTALNGKQAAGTYNTIIGTDGDINTSGATIIDNLYMTDGVITSHGTRNLTLGDLGAGSLASLSSVGAAQITDNSVGAAELNVSGNGTAGQALVSDGDGTMSWVDAGGGGAASSTVQVFTSSGTWTKPADCKKVKVTVTGGGGGGGGSLTTHGGGGGGAGGTAVELIDVSSLSSVSVTVGAGGSAGAYNGSGGTGGTSSFGAYCSATGGTGGAAAGNDRSSRGGDGGIGSGGNLNLHGNGGGAGGEYGVKWSGAGGGSFWQGGGRGQGTYTSNIAGEAGTNGGGGSGGVRSSQPGGAGGTGIVVIEEWY